MSRTRHIYIYVIYMTLLVIEINLLYQFNQRLIAPLFSFFSWNVWNRRFLKFSKVGRSVIGWQSGNQFGIYRSKVAEGFSAFQRRSCQNNMTNITRIPIRTFGNRCLSAIGGANRWSRFAEWVQLSAEAAWPPGCTASATLVCTGYHAV